MTEQADKVQRIEGLMTQYGDYIIRFCYMYLKNWHLAEDASQEVFLKSYKHLESFREEATEKTWLSSIAINVCRNYSRTSWFKKVAIGIEVDSKSTEYSMEEMLLKKVEESEILKVVGELPIKYKEVILLYYYEELKIKEIATILHINEEAVKMRLSRARKRVSTVLKEVALDGRMV